MKIWIKTQIVLQADREEFLVGACDKPLLGKTFDHFKLTEHFFKGDLVDIEQAINIIKRATSANLVGEHIVKAALDAKLITKDGIKKVQKIPHAQLYLF